MKNDTEAEGSEIHFSMDPFSRSGKFYLRGKLDMKQFSLLRQYMERSQHKVMDFKLNLKNVTSVDSESIYLLFSIYQTMMKLKKPLNVDGASPMVFNDAVKKSGFSKFSWLCFKPRRN